MNDPGVLVAAITAISAVVVALIQTGRLQRRAKRTEAKQDQFLAMVQTNHGMEPWQYFEMIGSIDAKLDKHIETEERRGSYVLDTLADHSRRLTTVERRR